MTALALAALLALGAGPFEREHARSREARERIAGQDPSAALPAYDALEAELGARPDVAAGRGAALERLGRHAEAGAAFERARKAPEPLGSRALLGLGNARAGQGDHAGAVAAYREALARDPAYADARHNLEVVLRRQEESAPKPDPSQAPQPASPDAARRDQGAGGQQQERQSPGPEGPKPGGAPRPGADGRPRPAPGEGERRSGSGEAGASADGRLSREEAERLLDAMRSRERNLPARARPRGEGRRDAQRDW